MGHDSTGRCLRDELGRQKDRTVLLGTRSSFFFIGPASEAVTDIRIVSLMAKLCVTIAAKRTVTPAAIKRATCDIGRRMIIREYVRDGSCGNGETVILVEGNEFGAFWTREEYLAGKQSLLAALGNAEAT